MASQHEIESFIRSSFRSVWSLELLLLLKRQPRCWSRFELVAALRASDLVVSQALHGLVAAGLVAVDAEGAAAYSPFSERVADLVEGAEGLYARSPDAVRRLIVASASGLAAFADAFRLWKE